MLRWRTIRWTAAIAWLAACSTGNGAPRASAHGERAPRPAAAPRSPASPARAGKTPASTPVAAPARPPAPPRPGRALSPALREVSLEPSALAEILAAMPETRALAAKFRPFSEQALSRALAAQRARQAAAPAPLGRAALLWSPPRGDQVMVLSGDTPQGAMLLAYATGAAGGPRFAGSYQTRGEHAPILFGARGGAREELLFSTCWACAGEGGALRVDAAGRPRLVLR